MRQEEARQAVKEIIETIWSSFSPSLARHIWSILGTKLQLLDDALPDEEVTDES